MRTDNRLCRLPAKHSIVDWTKRIELISLNYAVQFTSRTHPYAAVQERANGLSGRSAGDAIVRAILDHFDAEITVLDKHGVGELFRIGVGDPSHGIRGVHIHPVNVQWQTWELRAHKDAIEFLTDDHFNMYLGSLLQGLETGRYRAGFKFR